MPQLLRRRAATLVMVILFLIIDYQMGPYVAFPIAFVIPITFTAWWHGRVAGIILATILFSSQEHWPVTLGLFNFKGTYTSEWSLLSAATMIVAAPLLLVYLFLQRYLVASVVGGAVKG